ncbi:hypothetical protein BDZ97DRAFT_1811321 [Flammula alnicola]|nr:hypothetical protein BDZ97DRAFT_1811321 [Flammula alnicola]
MPWSESVQGGGRPSLSSAEYERVLDVMAFGWREGSRSAYGSGLLIYHVFCDLSNLSEDERCPARTSTILSFIAACAGSYSGDTLAGYVQGVHAWHTLHGAVWSMQRAELQAVLAGAATLAPPSSKREKREPFTEETLCHLRATLDLNDPLDVAVWACLTTTFWSAARVGEFTLKSLTAFKAAPAIYVKRSNVKVETDNSGNQTTSFFLPQTKVAPTGESVFWTRQNGICDPEAALQRHFEVNNPHATDDALFSWRHPKGMRPLTRTAFIKRLDTAAEAAGMIDKLQFHGLRIGAVLVYLLRGVPFDVVKTMGRWAGDSFLRYLRKHAVIIAPYIQNTPLEAAIGRLMMPPIRRGISESGPSFDIFQYVGSAPKL